MVLKYKNSLCIIIPAYNEDEGISSCVEKVLKETAKIKSKTLLVIVDDGSRDKTSEILKKKKHKFREKLVILQHKKNEGYGKALQSGISYALKNGFEFYLTMDSDLTNPPKYIHDFIRAMSDDVDCVKASRYVKGGKIINVPIFRKAISVVGNYLAALCFNVGVRDCTNGFKMVRLELLKNISFKENNFSIILEEMYYLKKKGARFAEIPNILYARKSSSSHFKYKPKIFYDYFKYLLKALILKY